MKSTIKMYVGLTVLCSIGVIKGMELTRFIPTGNIYEPADNFMGGTSYYRMNADGSLGGSLRFSRFSGNNIFYGSKLFLHEEGLTSIQVITDITDPFIEKISLGEQGKASLPILALTQKQIEKIKLSVEDTVCVENGERFVYTDNEDKFIIVVDSLGDIHKLVAVEEVSVEKMMSHRDRPLGNPAFLGAYVTSNKIFMWVYRDQQYYALTEQGRTSANLLKKDDHIKKQYKAQLLVDKDGNCYIRTTQELTSYFMKPGFRNLEKHQRSLIPILISDQQIEAIEKGLKYRSKQEEKVIVVDTENNAYCIKHVYRAPEGDSQDGDNV